MKHNRPFDCFATNYGLQQYLPFMVLKQALYLQLNAENVKVATVLTVYGIETITIKHFSNVLLLYGCNSTYRLRY